MAEDCEDKKKEMLRHWAGEQAFELQLKENKLRPSSPCFARSLPLRGSREAADNFCLIVRKHDETRGSREAADNFCRKK